MSIQGAGVELGNLNYTVQDPYNGTGPTGGDSLVQDLNVFYQVRDRLMVLRRCKKWVLTKTCSLAIWPG